MVERIWTKTLTVALELNKGTKCTKMQTYLELVGIGVKERLKDSSKAYFLNDWIEKSIYHQEKKYRDSREIFMDILVELSSKHFDIEDKTFEDAAAAAPKVTSVVSDSVWLHRRHPIRLCHPQDSPGKNTGVGCHFLLQCMNVKSESEFTQLCPTLHDPMDCGLLGSSIHGIFQARVLEWVAIAFPIWRCYGVNK